MTDKPLYFVDTNLLVYGQDPGFPEKRKTALEWMEYLWANQNGRLSIQVLNEYWVTVTQKLKPGISPSEAWKDLEALFTWRPLSLDEAVLNEARKVSRQANLSWWDALIIGASQLTNCQYLLSEDFNDQQIIGGVQVLNPFTISIPQ